MDPIEHKNRSIYGSLVGEIYRLPHGNPIWVWFLKKISGQRTIKWISGQITIVPKPEWRAFLTDSFTFHHHLGWPRLRSRKIAVPQLGYYLVMAGWESPLAKADRIHGAWRRMQTFDHEGGRYRWGTLEIKGQIGLPLNTYSLQGLGQLHSRPQNPGLKSIHLSHDVNFELLVKTQGLTFEKSMKMKKGI